MEQFQGGYPFKLQQGINATWRMPSRNQAECHAQGCGCKRYCCHSIITLS